MSVAAEITKAAGGAWVDNGIVTELKAYGSSQYAVIDLGGKIVEARVPGHFRGPVREGAAVQILGDQNLRTVNAILSDLAWITAGFSVQPGWSLAFAGYRWSMGPQVTMALRLIRTGSAITASSTGHLADMTILTAPAACLPTFWPINSIQMPVWRASTTIGGGYLGPVSGNLILTDLHSGASIQTDDQIQANFSYAV